MVAKKKKNQVSLDNLLSKRTVRGQHTRVPRLQIHFNNNTKTKQSFKDECNINLIMARYQKTGALDHVNKHGINYGFATSKDFTESMLLVSEAQQMFDDLPSNLRTQFNQDPGSFLDFVSDPENAAEMAEMGLTQPQGRESISMDPEPSEELPQATTPDEKSVESTVST